MGTGNMRRSQLVSPFGVGAMSMLVDGTSVITAGLDQWFVSDDPSNVSVDEFVAPEWRLEERLHVHQLRLPPDYRRRSAGQSPINRNLSVPVLRFPRWSFCIYCKRLQRSPLSLSERVRCKDDRHNEMKRRPPMVQVPFVTICESGHLDDFPWLEWVHRNVAPSCHGPLRLFARGGGSLAGQIVHCDQCGAERTLDRVTTSKRTDRGEETALTTELSKQEPFPCKGSRPWVADPGSGCGQPLRAALRGAGNVYFPQVESSIYLPPQKGLASGEVLDLMRRPDIYGKLDVMKGLVGRLTPTMIRTKIKPPNLFAPFTDTELQAGLDEIAGPADESDAEVTDDDAVTSTEDLRRPEHVMLRSEMKHSDLTVRDVGLPEGATRWFASARAVDVLRETRVMRGFTRVRDGALKLSDGKALMRARPVSPDDDWLPAYVVRGEGIFLELEPNALHSWETGPDVQKRVSVMASTFETARERRGLKPRSVIPRFVLLHTLAHLLINEFVYSCGYSSASLRERLYVSSDAGREMAGVLIYTAAGDSEGTMGGLVRMGRPENFGRVLETALSKAAWCSADPVCMELGEAGQGPESCNMAACHGCALLPETSCEEFNRFLDRGVVVGSLAEPHLGFFTMPSR
ncbi:DrmB family protein [Actinomycetospora atypica]|uniref:DrmB family protein n=1 Tax=Actinomycetospora atypica TaxID=1290095 RepID=A0ABV9YFI9_9PSEU